MLVLEAKAINKTKAYDLLPAVLKSNQLDMAAEIGIIFGTLASELQGKIINAADKDGQITSKVAGILDWFKSAWRKSFDEYRKAFIEKMEFAARVPYEAEAVLFSYYFGTDTLEGAGSYSGSFGTTTGPFWDDYIERQARKNIEAAASKIYGDGLNLSNRLWKLDAKSYSQIQSTLMQGVVQKKSAAEIAKELGKHLDPDAKWTRWSMSRLNKMVPADRAKDFKGLLRKPNPIPFDGAPPTSGIAYNALRLARHELNTIGVNASLDSMRSAPWATGEKWNLSTNHSIIDICDDYASGGPESNGAYSAGQMPTMPAHVNCYCYPTAELMERDNFVDNLRGWAQGTSSWPEMDAYATRVQGHPGYGALAKLAQNITKVKPPEPKQNKKPSRLRDGVDRALNKALEHGIETDTEMLIAVDARTGEELISQAGGARSVQPTEEFYNLLESADNNSIILVHNHPGSSSFSVNDVNFLGKYESLKRHEVIGHDGTKYYLSKKKGYTYDRTATFVDHQMCVDRYLGKYANKVASGEMTNQEAWKKHSHEALRDFVELHKFRYKRELPRQ